jgi:hypothetical protein
MRRLFSDLLYRSSNSLHRSKPPKRTALEDGSMIHIVEVYGLLGHPAAFVSVASLPKFRLCCACVFGCLSLASSEPLCYCSNCTPQIIASWFLHGRLQLTLRARTAAQYRNLSLLVCGSTVMPARAGLLLAPAYSSPWHVQITGRCVLSSVYALLRVGHTSNSFFCPVEQIFYYFFLTFFS